MLLGFSKLLCVWLCPVIGWHTVRVSSALCPEPPGIDSRFPVTLCRMCRSATVNEWMYSMDASLLFGYILSTCCNICGRERNMDRETQRWGSGKLVLFYLVPSSKKVQQWHAGNEGSSALFQDGDRYGGAGRGVRLGDSEAWSQECDRLSSLGSIVFSLANLQKHKGENMKHESTFCLTSVADETNSLSLPFPGGWAFRGRSWLAPLGLATQRAATISGAVTGAETPLFLQQCCFLWSKSTFHCVYRNTVIIIFANCDE